jgi:hypothetical protein
MKSLPYETATAGDRALQELQRVLEGFGCQNFGTMIDNERQLAQGRISVCSVLRDWVKAQTVAIECGVLQFEEVFMPHMLLPDGRRVIQAAREAKVLPQLGQDDQKVIELKP